MNIPTPPCDLTPPNVIRALHIHVLQKLNENDDIFFYTRELTNNHYPRDLITAVLKDLRGRGYVEFQRGLMDDEGTFCGAGNAITAKGQAYLANLLTTQNQDAA